MTSAVRGLRILGLCDYFSADSSGGSERAALEVYRRLAAEGATVRVITTLLRHEWPTPQLDGVEIRVLPSVDLSRLLRIQVGLSPVLFARLRSMIADFQPDVIHGHTLFFQTALAGAMAQRATGIPLVTTVQIAGLDYLSEPVRTISRSYEATAGRFILSRSARLIAVSPSVRAHLLRLGADPPRIAVIPNGVDLDQFGGERPSTTATTPVIAFVGRLIANKGPEVLLAALLELHRQQVPFRARFYGDGPMRESLEAHARPAGRSIEFAGHVPDVAARLVEADILVRPSLTEGLPLAVLEAMASRVCVIASDVPGNSDLIRDGINGLLVPARNVTGLAGAIRAMIEDPARRRHLAAGGHETARAYSWERVAAATGELLAATTRRNRAAA